MFMGLAQLLRLCPFVQTLIHTIEVQDGARPPFPNTVAHERTLCALWSRKCVGLRDIRFGHKTSYLKDNGEWVQRLFLVEDPLDAIWA